jgi:DNA-binding NarL/FixJ family response regulator
MQKVVRSRGSKVTMAGSSLSKREGEVFQLLGCGYGPSQTAQELQLSVKTVEGYLERIKKKLGIGDSRTLRQYAIQQGRVAKGPGPINVCL